MKTKSEIEMDFNRAVAQADELLNVSKKLSGIVNRNAEAFGVLSSGWIGDNSNKFREKGNALEREMLSAADDLNRISENIRKTARLVYNAEKAAAQIGY